MKSTPSESSITQSDRDTAQRDLFALLDRWHVEDGTSAERYRAKVAAALARLAEIDAVLVPLAAVA